MSSDNQVQDGLLTPELRRIAPYCLLVFAVFVSYLNIYDNAFLFDDNLLIQLNGYLQDWSHIGEILTRSTTSGVHIEGGFYRPMQLLLYLFMNHLGGGASFPFHALNVALHMVNVCFVYRLGIKLGFDPRGVLLAALIWAVHPLHVEAVTYMSATADPLFALFCLWGVIYAAPDFTPQKILRSFPFFVFAVGSKETAVMFPGLLMVCLFLSDPKRLQPRTYWRTWPLWAASLIYVYWRSHATGFDGPQTYAHDYTLPSYANLKLYAEHPLYRIYTFWATLPMYLGLMFYPTGLHMERALSVYTEFFVPVVWGGCAIFMLAAAQIVYAARTGRGLPMAWGLLWFGAAHGPDSGILIPANSLFLEHWMYLPTVGLFLGTGETVVKFLNGRRKVFTQAVCVAALVFAGLLGAKTVRQNEIWHDPDIFYNNIFKYGEKSARAHNNLALYYTEQDRFADAIEQYKLAAETSDIYAETHYNMALTYLHMPPGQRAHADEAIAQLKRAIEIDPNFYRAYLLMSQIYETLLNEPETAKEYKQRAQEALARQH